MNMSSKIVAVAGGSGNIGRAIVDELIAHGGYKVFIFGRQASDGKSEELGAPILTTNYSDHASLIALLESNNIDTVVSTLSSTAGADPELALIKAAEASSVTKRYIPSIWGVRYNDEVAKYYPLTHVKQSALSTLASSSLEYTSVLNGFFLDYFGIPHIKTYLPAFPLVLDMANNMASIPASGDIPVTFTYSFDVGRFVGKLLSEPVWEKESIIVGDNISWNQFLALAEEVKGTKFSVSHDSMEMLRKGQITELLGHKELYPVFPKQSLQSISAVFCILMEEGLVTLKREGSLNERYKDIEVKTARDLLEEAWKGK